jgi:hypothetical protein
MLNCPYSLAFSSTHSLKRLKKANKILGKSLVNRIIGFALFLLGAKREDIAQYLSLPFGTFLSFLTRIDQHGLLAFEDRRKLPSAQPEKVRTPPEKIRLSLKDTNICIQSGCQNQSLNIPCNNSLQSKVVLLSFFKSGLFSANDIAHVLGLSERHIRYLADKLHEHDVFSLIDKRAGQRPDYQFSPEIKAELIQQFAANAITGKPTSSRAISEQINKQCKAHFSDRSVRLHMQKLGLPQIAKSLPALIDTLKKTPLDDS